MSSSPYPNQACSPIDSSSSAVSISNRRRSYNLRPAFGTVFLCSRSLNYYYYWVTSNRSRRLYHPHYNNSHRTTLSSMVTSWLLQTLPEYHWNQYRVDVDVSPHSCGVLVKNSNLNTQTSSIPLTMSFGFDCLECWYHWKWSSTVVWNVVGSCDGRTRDFSILCPDHVRQLTVKQEIMQTSSVFQLTHKIWFYREFLQFRSV